MTCEQVRQVPLVSNVRHPSTGIVTFSVQVDHDRKAQIDLPMDVPRMMTRGPSIVTQYTER